MRLWRRDGWGSALIEVQAAAYGLPLERIEVSDLFEDPDAAGTLDEVNPLRQIPVLEMDDGSILTESAAITLHLADLTGSDFLVPGPGEAARPAFLRGLIWLVTNIYPCFTFGDDPTRFVADADAAKDYATRVGCRLEDLWRMLEAEAQTRAHCGPWFLGARLSAIDIYIAVMAHWNPGPDWFRDNVPRLWSIREGILARPDTGPALAEQFPDHT